MLDLLFAIEHEVARVARGLLHSPVAVVRFLVRRLACDAEVLHAREAADAVGMDVRLDVVELEVEPDIAVEITVVVVAGVTFLRTPHLFRRLDVAPERGDARRREDRRVNPETRPRMAEHDAVRVHDEPADFGLMEKLLDAWHVGALGQPEPAW